ncbi:uncharacterized protein LOC114928154 [Nylanderia fulva]|uniref:uncharacterized protein LOC114928154 n=1 Tax=Nylanderia fulva TaxID=613905 RepID=UPI0010FBA2EB|nr:uncharacterized protein LOC114928154 [Nylanderia fulva]
MTTGDAGGGLRTSRAGGWEEGAATAVTAPTPATLSGRARAGCARGTAGRRGSSARTPLGRGPGGGGGTVSRKPFGAPAARPTAGPRPPAEGAGPTPLGPG